MSSNPLISMIANMINLYAWPPPSAPNLPQLRAQLRTKRHKLHFAVDLSHQQLRAVSPDDRLRCAIFSRFIINIIHDNILFNLIVDSQLMCFPSKDSLYCLAVLCLLAFWWQDMVHGCWLGHRFFPSVKTDAVGHAIIYENGFSEGVSIQSEMYTAAFARTVDTAGKESDSTPTREEEGIRSCGPSFCWKVRAVAEQIPVLVLSAILARDILLCFYDRWRYHTYCARSVDLRCLLAGSRVPWCSWYAACGMTSTVNLISEGLRDNNREGWMHEWRLSQECERNRRRMEQSAEGNVYLGPMREKCQSKFKFTLTSRAELPR